MSQPLHTVSRAEAQRAFAWFLQSIPERLRQLQGLVAEESILLDYSLDSLNRLEAWFPRHVESIIQSDGSWAPTPKTFSICNDLGMYLGEMLIKMTPGVRWTMFVWGKRDVAYQRPVIMGFRNIPNKKYNVDFDFVICQYAFRLVNRGKNESSFFRHLIRSGSTQ